MPAARFPSLKDLIESGDLSKFETKQITLANGVKRLVFIYDVGEEARYFQGGQFVPTAVINNLNELVADHKRAMISRAVIPAVKQRVRHSMRNVEVDISRQISEGLFNLGKVLELSLDQTYEAIFKQLNVMGAEALNSSDKYAGRWWTEETGKRPDQRYTGYLFGSRNVVTGVKKPLNKGFVWPDVSILDKEAQHWRVIEFGNKNERKMPAGWLYPPGKDKPTNTKFTFKRPDTSGDTGKAGRTTEPIWTGPRGFKVKSTEELDAKQLAERAMKSTGMMVKNEPKYLFATVISRAFTPDRLKAMFNDLAADVYGRTMVDYEQTPESAGEALERVQLYTRGDWS